MEDILILWMEVWWAMEEKPIHFDGSSHRLEIQSADVAGEGFELTDEVRVSISGNPYIYE
jgi:hypothetical protein